MTRSTPILLATLGLVALGERCPGGCRGGHRVPGGSLLPRGPAQQLDVGQVTGVAVDDRDHVWIVHRPGQHHRPGARLLHRPPTGMCCDPAPPVIEFDPDGNVVRAWGGPGEATSGLPPGWGSASTASTWTTTATSGSGAAPAPP
jgi:hypothetical protein